MSSCSYAYAVAAAREETPIFLKMLLTCRSTVRLLSDQVGCDRLVALSRGEQAQHLQLALRQPAAVARPGVADERVDSREVACCAQLLEGVAGRFQLQRDALVVAQRAAGLCEKHADACAFIRRLELLPEPRRATEHQHGVPRVASGQVDRTARLRRLRPQQLAAVPRGELFELGAGIARACIVSSGQSNLDLGGQEPDSLHPLGRSGERLSNRGVRGVRASLRQAQQGETRLRLTAEPACIVIRLLGLRHCALETEKLAAPVRRFAGVRSARSKFEPLACEPRLLQRGWPLPMELQKLRPMDQADPRKGHEAGLVIAPLTQSGCPLGGAA